MNTEEKNSPVFRGILFPFGQQAAAGHMITFFIILYTY